MVHFVGAGSGAADLITLRGKKLLEEADVIIYAGSLVNPQLLEYAREDCTIFNSAKMTLEEVLEVIFQAEEEGKTTVRLHTGDPCLYGAIREQMDALDDGILFSGQADICHRLRNLFTGLSHRGAEVGSDAFLCSHLPHHFVDLFRGGVHAVRSVSSMAVYVDKTRNDSDRFRANLLIAFSRKKISHITRFHDFCVIPDIAGFYFSVSGINGLVF